MTTLSILSGAHSTGKTNVANTNTFSPICGSCDVSLQTETNSQTIMEDAGTFQNMYLRLTANSCSGTTTFTMRDAVTSKNETVAPTTTQTGEFEDTTHTDAVTTGHKYDVLCSPAGGSTGTVTV